MEPNMQPRWGFLRLAIIYYKRAAPTELDARRFRFAGKDP